MLLEDLSLRRWWCSDTNTSLISWVSITQEWLICCHMWSVYEIDMGIHFLNSMGTSQMIFICMLLITTFFLHSYPLLTMCLNVVNVITSEKHLQILWYLANWAQIPWTYFLFFFMPIADLHFKFGSNYYCFLFSSAEISAELKWSQIHVVVALYHCSHSFWHVC